MISSKLFLLLFIVLFLMGLVLWYLSPVGDFIRSKIEASRSNMDKKLNKKRRKDEPESLY